MVLESTKLVNTYGTVASAIYASSGSKVTTVDVDMSGLEGPDDCNFENSGVIVGELADSFIITNSIWHSDTDIQFAETNVLVSVLDQYITPADNYPHFWKGQ